MGALVATAMCVDKLEILLSSFRTSTCKNGLPSEIMAYFLWPNGCSRKGQRRFWCPIAQPGMLLSGEIRWNLRFYPNKWANNLERVKMKGSRKKRRGRGSKLWIAFFFLNSLPLVPVARVTIGTRKPFVRGDQGNLFYSVVFQFFIKDKYVSIKYTFVSVRSVCPAAGFRKWAAQAFACYNWVEEWNYSALHI